MILQVWYRETGTGYPSMIQCASRIIQLWTIADVPIDCSRRIHRYPIGTYA